MEYRFRIVDCIKGTVYKLEWDEMTTYPNGTTPSANHLSEEVTGTGDLINGAVTSVHTVGVPSQPSVIKAAHWTATIVNSGTGGS